MDCMTATPPSCAASARKELTKSALLSPKVSPICE